MKKYLISGVLALLVGFFVSSCSETEVDYVPVATQKVRAFEEIFKEVYGEIDSQQNWGFTDEIVIANSDDVEPTVVEESASARIRAARTRATVDTKGNMWNLYETVPTVGETESADVFNYVDTVKTAIPRYYEEFPENLKDFFVTHIYTGTDYYGSYDTPNQKNILGSSKMNELQIAETSTAVINDDGSLSDGWFHVNDFNAANNSDYNGNMLVYDAGTYDFAYKSSEDSKYHNKWIVVDGDDINSEKYGGYYYVCFDFISWQNGCYTIFEVPELNNSKINVPGAWRNVAEVLAAGITEVSYEDYSNWPKVETKTIEINSNWKWTQVVNGNMCIPADNVYTDWIIRLVKAEKKKENKSKITSETSATEVWSQVESQSGRVFCEDLGKAAREDLDYNDVVFDVIIWSNRTMYVTKTTTKTWTTVGGVVDSSTERTTTKNDTTYSAYTYYAQVQLLAAGGTLPLTVQGKEVHTAFNVGISTMVNTRDAKSTTYGSYVTKDPVDIGDIEKSVNFNGKTYDLKLFKDIQRASDIAVVVNYQDNQVQELHAEPGKAPHKLFVSTSTVWTSERKPLDLAYPGFTSYVSSASNTGWYNGEKNNYYIYDGDSEGLANVPKVMKVKTISGTQEVTTLTSGAHVFTEWNPEVFTLNIGEFFPGDRLRFYGSGLNADSYISVNVVDNSGNVTGPYIDTKFADALDKEGNYPETAYIDLLLDETYTELFNNYISNGQLTLKIYGRSFTLDQIALVPF